MAKKDRRLQAAPRFQWTYETGKLYKQLPASSKHKVFGRYFDWLKSARERNADYNALDFDKKGLSDNETDCLESMVENTRDGFDSLWSRSKKDDEQSDTVSDSLGQSDAAIKEREEKKEINKREEKKETNKREEREEINGFSPTLEDVKRYISEKGYTFSPGKFFSCYQAKNWKGIADWKAQADYWQMNEKTGRYESERQGNYDQYESDVMKELYRT